MQDIIEILNQATPRDFAEMVGCILGLTLMVYMMLFYTWVAL